MNGMLESLSNEEVLTLIRRFMSKVRINEDGCWIWIGGTTASGYGSIKVAGKMRGAHRLSYELFVLSIESSIMVCHTCDIPLCVNPDHLFHGNSKDNQQDALRKNRSYQRLSVEQVLYLRNNYDPQKHAQKDLADAMGISRNVINCMLIGRTFTHVGGKLHDRSQRHQYNIRLLPKQKREAYLVELLSGMPKFE